MAGRVALFCAVAGAGFLAATNMGATATANSATARVVVVSGLVVAVPDGDSLSVRLPNGLRDRVRLLGIDAPEMQPRERCASQSTVLARRLALGKNVRLTLDRTQAKRDRYGRLWHT